MRVPFVLAQESLRKYLRTGVAIDTSLLLLTAVGRYQQGYIRQFKRTREFTAEDYELLTRFLEKFHSFIVSPHVLAEVSNHSFEIPRPRLDVFLDGLIELLKPFVEEHIGKGLVFAHQDFKRLGVTDTGLVIRCKEAGYLLISKDRQLCQIAAANGVGAVHFDDLRVYSLNADLEF
jgi:hypothetical protein